MDKKRAFISFDYDHDRLIKEYVVGQAKNPNSPFDIVDASVKKHMTGDWQEKVRNRIRRADLVVVMCGEYTHQAEGVATELKIAQEEDVDYFLLRGHKDRVCTKPTTARSDDDMHEWTWDNLRQLIEGKSLVESVLSHPATWVAVGVGLALWIESRNRRNRFARPDQFAGTRYAQTWPRYSHVWDRRY